MADVAPHSNSYREGSDLGFDCDDCGSDNLSTNGYSNTGRFDVGVNFLSVYGQHQGPLSEAPLLIGADAEHVTTSCIAAREDRPGSFDCYEVDSDIFRTLEVDEFGRDRSIRAIAASPATVKSETAVGERRECGSLADENWESQTAELL